MRKLDRNAVAVPVCLNPAVHPSYGHLHGADKAQIRAALLAMQGHRCAYCERRTGAAPEDGHIEHFRGQAAHPGLSLAWTNMFWSCQDEKTCGKHKDKCDRPVGSGPQATFNPNVLLDPALDEPDDFFQFVVDGTINPKPGLAAPNNIRASETLRVFQLSDSPFLRQSREDSLGPYVRFVASLTPLGPQAVRDYIAGEIAATRSAPFAGAVRQFLQSLSP